MSGSSGPVDNSDCAICLEPKRLKSTGVLAQREARACFACDVALCRTCIKESLLQTPDALQCPNCRATWTSRFVVESIGTTFLSSQKSGLRRAQQLAIVESARAHFETDMPHVAEYRTRSRLLENVRTAQRRVSIVRARACSVGQAVDRLNYSDVSSGHTSLRRAIRSSYRKPYPNRLSDSIEAYLRSIRDTENNKYEFGMRVLDLFKHKRALVMRAAQDGASYAGPKIPGYLSALHQAARELRLVLPPGTVDEKKRDDDPRSAPVYAAPCPTSCRGLVRADTWACELCSVRICPRCREALTCTADAAESAAEEPTSDAGAVGAVGAAGGAGGAGGAGPSVASEHHCDPDSVATITLLRRDTKPCPVCATPIHRVSGCPQMWCPCCKNLFDWNTRRQMYRGIVHNPHAVAYLRQHGMTGSQLLGEATRRGPTRRGPPAVGCPGTQDAFETMRVAFRRIETNLQKALSSLPPAARPSSPLLLFVAPLHRTLGDNIDACQSHTRGLERMRTELPDRQRLWRFRFLTGDIDTAELGRRLWLLRRTELRNQHCLDVLTACTEAALSTMLTWSMDELAVGPENANWAPCVAQVREISQYFTSAIETELKSIGVPKSNSVAFAPDLERRGRWHMYTK